MNEIYELMDEIIKAEAEAREKEFFETLLRDGDMEVGVLIANPVHKEDLEKFGGQFLFSKAADVNKIYVAKSAELKREIKRLIGKDEK